LHGPRLTGNRVADPALRPIESGMISGNTTSIAHIGYPAVSFKAPLICNPWFEKAGIDAVVVLMGVKTDDYPGVLRALSRLTNFRGALITMPHKVTSIALVDECTTTVEIAGSGNVVRLRPDGTLLGDMFDGMRFTRSRAQGIRFRRRALPRGRDRRSGIGDRSMLAADGVATITLFDTSAASAESLAARLRRHCPHMRIDTRSSDPARLRAGRERNAARHETHGSAALRRHASRASRRRPSWARW
jgi:shikimate dehydrogenase